MRISHVFSLSVLACIALCAVTWAAESTAVKESVVPADVAGFIQLFNSKEFIGWEGGTKLWIVPDLLTEAIRQERSKDWNAVYLNAVDLVDES